MSSETIVRDIISNIVRHVEKEVIKSPDSVFDLIDKTLTEWVFEHEKVCNVVLICLFGVNEYFAGCNLQNAGNAFQDPCKCCKTVPLELQGGK